MTPAPLNKAGSRRLPGITPIELANCAQFKRDYWQRNPVVAAATTEAARQKAILVALGCFDEAHSLAPVTKDALGWGA